MKQQGLPHSTAIIYTHFRVRTSGFKSWLSKYLTMGKDSDSLKPQFYHQQNECNICIIQRLNVIKMESAQHKTTRNVHYIIQPYCKDIIPIVLEIARNS